MNPALIKLLLAVLSALAKWVPTALAYFAGARKGRNKERLAQRDHDLTMAAAALRARRNVRHDPDSVRNDPRNRDES